MRPFAFKLFLANASLISAISIGRVPVTFAESAEPRAQAKNGPRTYKGRVIAPVMSAAGGGTEWLERADRDALEQPDKVIESLKIPPGSVVADVGAGTGYFSIRIAKRIGPDGKVLATDVQPEMLRQLNENMKKANVKNIERILATANDARLPANKVDLVLMVDVYHELQDPERTIAQIRKALKDDGRLVLVEYRAEDPSVPILEVHKTTLRQVRYELEPMGFRLRELFEFLPHQHVEVFGKDTVMGEEPQVDSNDFPTIRKPGWSGVADAEPYERGGFGQLFNGKDLTGWKSSSKAWTVQDELLVGTSQAAARAGAELQTAENYGDFELDLQWRPKNLDDTTSVSIGANRRLSIRLDGGVPIAPGYPETIAQRRTGEVTIDGSDRPIQPATDMAKALVFPGDWNRMSVRARGNRITLGVNGIKTVQFDAAEQVGSGPIGIHASPSGVEFREIWIRRLSDQP